MSKYNNKKTMIDGIKFDSKDEAEYYLYLKDKKAKGEIKDFVLQQKFELQPKFKKFGVSERAITYTVDFAIYKWNGEVEYIDVKGFGTQQGEIKRKIFDYNFPEKLTWVSKSKKYGVDGWIEYKELNKKKREAKKNKK